MALRDGKTMAELLGAGGDARDQDLLQFFINISTSG